MEFDGYICCQQIWCCLLHFSWIPFCSLFRCSKYLFIWFIKISLICCYHTSADTLLIHKYANDNYLFDSSFRWCLQKFLETDVLFLNFKFITRFECLPKELQVLLLLKQVFVLNYNQKHVRGNFYGLKALPKITYVFDICTLIIFFLSKSTSLRYSPKNKVDLICEHLQRHVFGGERPSTFWNKHLFLTLLRVTSSGFTKAFLQKHHLSLFVWLSYRLAVVLDNGHEPCHLHWLALFLFSHVIEIWFDIIFSQWCWSLSSFRQVMLRHFQC